MAEEETTETSEETTESTETESTEPTKTSESTETADALAISDDWRAPIGDEKARDFANTFATPALAAEAAYKFKQQISKGISIPDENSDEDAIKDYRSKLGIPSEADGYKLEAPKDLSDELKESVFESEEGKVVLDRFRAVAHKNNVSPQALQEIVSEYLQLTAESQQTINGDATRNVEAATDNLKREWGKDFEANENYGREAVTTFGDTEFVKFLEDTTVDGVQLGDHPAFRRTFAVIGRSVGEDGFQAKPSESESGSINDELDELYGLMNTNMEKYQSAAVQSRITTLNERIHGDAPIVGSEGRVS